jgi:transposase
MTQIHDIRKLYFEEGKNISQIARETGYDRKTIRAYIKKEDWNQEIPEPVKENDFPKLEPFKAIIDGWLLEDKKAKRKQRHTAKRVYDRLKEPEEGVKGFNCSYRTVAAYVAIKKKDIFGKEKLAYIPLEHIPGEAQVDFGDSDFYINSQFFSGKHLNLSFPSSNQGYVQLFKGENQQCLFEGLIAIFIHIGGVPIRLWFDNASTIVTKVLKNGGRNLTDDFMRFMEHYRFEAAFCNKNAGYEKGSVEGKVGYHRRNMLVPVPRISDLIIFNQELLLQCDTDAEREHYRKETNICELYQEDRQALLPLPDVALEVAKYVTVKTNGYGRFYLNSGLHEYSVSPKYANSRVLVRISAHDVIPLDDSRREIVRHPRLYGDFKQQSMQWLPYLTQLSRSPGALKYTGIYEMLPVTLQQLLESCDKSNKGKILRAIAALTENSNFESAVKTVETALLYGAYDTDSLVNLHSRIHDPSKELPPLSLGDSIPRLRPVISNLAAYDAGLNRQGGVPQC